MPAKLDLIPPYRYAMVEEGMFRGAYPSSKNFRFLLRLQLQTVVSLVPQAPTAELTEFCAANNINLVHMRVDVYKEKIPISPSGVAHVLSLILDKTRHPLLLHCMNGAEVTGIVIMCLRKIQNYSPNFAIVEIQRHLREGVFTHEMLEFYERFNNEVTIPAVIPSWLWEGQRRGQTSKAATTGQDGDAAASTATESGAQHWQEYKHSLLGQPSGASLPAALRQGSFVDETELSLTLRALSLEVGNKQQDK